MRAPREMKAGPLFFPTILAVLITFILPCLDPLGRGGPRSRVYADDPPQADPGAAGEERDSPSDFIRGDANIDGKVTLADVFSILGYLHKGASLHCFDAADANDDGAVSNADWLTVLVLVNRIGHPRSFQGRILLEGLRSPYPEMGADATDSDELGCARGPADREQPRPRAAQPKGGNDDSPGQAAENGPRLTVPCSTFSSGSEFEFIQFAPAELVVYPGQQDVRTSVVFETLIGDIEALTLSLHAPPSTIRLESLSFSERFLRANRISGSAQRFFEDARDRGHLAASLAVDLNTGRETLPEMTRRVIGDLTFSVSSDAPVGSEAVIRYAPYPSSGGTPEIPNELIREGRDAPHTRCGVLVRVVSPDSVFLRGDADRNWTVNLSDAVTILRFLFDGEPSAPSCLDAADVNDNGSIEISDVVQLARFLFLHGAAPLPPFPNPGPDSVVADRIGCL